MDGCDEGISPGLSLVLSIYTARTHEKGIDPGSLPSRRDMPSLSWTQLPSARRELSRKYTLARWTGASNPTRARRRRKLKAASFVILDPWICAKCRSFIAASRALPVAPVRFASSTEMRGQPDQSELDDLMNMGICDGSDPIRGTIDSRSSQTNCTETFSLCLTPQRSEHGILRSS